jgi:hypothetical protein
MHMDISYTNASTYTYIYIYIPPVDIKREWNDVLIEGIGALL